MTTDKLSKLLESGDSEYICAFRDGQRSRDDEVHELERKLGVAREALQNWIEFEREQIVKEGPYAGAKINELIAGGEQALEVTKNE